ncbi:MAG: hypothetical protein ABH891_00925 [Candidatus Omnitrophota bacterium]
MRHKVNMSCDDIKRRLQSFLDDLLAEDEFEAFRGHLNVCGKCEKYVRSIGSLSNQLWKLGKIRVPEDLDSTIMYKLVHFEEKTRPSKFVISKKHIVAGSILILLAGVIFFGTDYFKGQHAPNKNHTPIIKTEKIHESSVPTESETQRLLKQLETITTGLRGPIVEEGTRKETGMIEKDAIPQKPPAKDHSMLSKISFLHWHMVCSKKYENTDLKSGANLRRGMYEKYRKETELNSKLLDALRDAGISLDYQRNNMLVFNAGGETIEKLLEQILSLSPDTPWFRDFTTDTSTFRDKKYAVSIYIEREESNALHWHIDPLVPDKKSEILGIIKEFGYSADYDSDELVILSIPSTGLGKLRARIQAARVPFDEYGSSESKVNTLSSGPITLSIYFKK